METVKRPVVAKGSREGGGGMNRLSTEHFQNGKTIPYDIIMMDTCYTFVNTHGLYKIKSKRQRKLWTLVNNISMGSSNLTKIPH